MENRTDAAGYPTARRTDQRTLTPRRLRFEAIVTKEKPNKLRSIVRSKITAKDLNDPGKEKFSRDSRTTL